MVAMQNGRVAGPVVFWLRLEGLAVAALWLAPDLSMLGYMAGPRLGSYCYNAVHSYMAPCILAAAALLLHWNAVLPFVFLWFNHIGVDRLLGYGLKYPTAFGDTHLKQAGK